jgi:hypothetical protein
MLDEGMHATLEDLATAKDMNATYVIRFLRPPPLAPDLVEALLDGRQPTELRPDILLDRFLLEWEVQACVWVKKTPNCDGGRSCHPNLRR